MIDYKITANPLKPGTYYPRPVTRETRGIDWLSRSIARKSSLNSVTVQMVLLALRQEIVDTLSEGERVSLDELVQFSVRLSQVLRRPLERFDPRKGGKLLVAATIKPNITRDLRAVAEFRKVIR